MSTILTLDKLKEMVEEKILKIVKRHQKEGGVNYYFTPNIAIKLYKIEIFHYISFEKFSNLSEYKIEIENKNEADCSNHHPSIRKLNI